MIFDSIAILLRLLQYIYITAAKSVKYTFTNTLKRLPNSPSFVPFWIHSSSCHTKTPVCVSTRVCNARVLRKEFMPQEDRTVSQQQWISPRVQCLRHGLIFLLDLERSSSMTLDRNNFIIHLSYHKQCSTGNLIHLEISKLWIQLRIGLEISILKRGMHCNLF